MPMANIRTAATMTILANTSRWCVFLLVFFALFFSAEAFALNQLSNSAFDSNDTSWTAAQRQAITNPALPRTLDSDMTTYSWDATNGGCYYTSFLATGNNQDANAILSQNFSTPAASVNIRLGFDHLDLATSYDSHRLYGSIRVQGAGYPNEAIVNSFFTDIAAGHTAAWVSDTYNVALAPSSNFIYRVHWHFGLDNGVTAGAYVDNLRVDFSPTGLTAAVNGAANNLTWNASTGAAALHGVTPYKIYRSVVSGGPYVAVGTSNTNSWTDPAPPAGTFVYYVITDIDTDSIESPYSTEVPVIRMNVRDGTATDIDVGIGSVVNLNWDNVVFAKDRYEVALGTTPGGADVVAWTDAALATSYSFGGVSLVDGTTYYTSVRIITPTPEFATLNWSSSDGFVHYKFDVRDGLGADVDYTFSPDTVELNWDALGIPVLRYEVAVGSTFGGTDVVGWTNAGVVTSKVFTGLALVKNNFYFSSVRAYDMAGNLLGSSCSTGFEALIPTNIVVRDGLGPDIASTFFEDRVELNWDHVNASFYRYEVAVGTSKYNDDVYPWTSVGLARQATITGITLASGTTYYASVKGINTYKVIESAGATDGFVARRDPVLVDTASQSYFHNARVLDMIDTTTDAGSIRPKVFSGTGGGGYWRYSMPITVTEPGVTERFNAPCRIKFAIPVAQRPGATGEFRVADDAGNELPRYNLPASTVGAPDLVFLVNMALGETKTYWVYWGNTGVATTEANYGFTLNSDALSTTKWTPYYSRKNLPSGMEVVPRAYRFPLNGDDLGSAEFNLSWPFYFYGELNQNNWNTTTNGVLCVTSTQISDYSNTWAEFANAGRWTRLITPIWIDLRTGPIPPAPVAAGIYRDYLTNPDRVAFTWETNRYNSTDDIYIFQAVLYRTGDIALRYHYLSPLGLVGGGGTDFPVNTTANHTCGISYPDGNRWLINTPLVIGTNQTPTAFYQCMDAFTVGYGAITGGALGTWVDVGHFESMVFDSRAASPLWQRIEYDCAGNANNRLLISTRSGSTPLPDGSWTAWAADTTAIANGNTALASTNRYIQYRVRFQRNNNIGALPILSEVRFVHGGIAIEEIKATTPNGVSQGQTGIPVEVTIRNFYTAPVDLQSVKLTFTIGTYTQVLTGPPVPGTSIAAGGTTSVFFTVNVDTNSLVGTATVDAMATATVIAPALTFSDTDAQLPHQWRVRSKAQLVITRVETDETFVNKAQTDIYVRMHITNLGETPFTFDAASLTFTLGLYDPPTVLQSPALGAVIPELSTFIATFTVNVGALSPSGVAIIGGTASGTNTFTGLVTQDLVASITDSWTIQNPSQLVLEEVTASATVYRGQANTPVFLRVSNDGEATARWISSSIIPYLSLGLYDAEYPITPFEILIPGGFESIARYGVDISPITPVGTSTVDADVSGKDVNTGSAISWTNALIPGQWTILAEKVSTFKDAAHTQSSDSFNRPTAGTVSVYAQVENLNPFGEFVVRWIDPSGSQIAMSGPLTADASGTLSHEFTVSTTSDYGFYKVRITNPINTITSCENQFEVVSPAVLGALFSMPAKVSVGQPFVASYTFTNTGGAVVSSAYTSLLQVFGPGTALQTSGIPPVIDVPGNSQATTTFGFSAQGAGNFSASATAYGFDANSGIFLTSPAVTSNICLIQNAPIVNTISVAAVPTIVYRNQKNLQIVVNVSNTGQATAVLNTASLSFTLGSFDQNLLSPALPYSLLGGANINLTYDIGVSPTSATGVSIFSSNVLWYDENWPASTTYMAGAAPNDQWTVSMVGIKLSSNEDFDFEQADFNRNQVMFIRAFGLTPNSQWYRIRVYNTAIPQAGTGPVGWQNVSPLLKAGDTGDVDYLYTIPAAAAIGTWSVLIEDDLDSSSGTRGNLLGLQYFRVQNPGNLVASLTISPTSVYVGENFTVTMLATNTVTSGSTISNASPSDLVDASAFPNFAGSASLVSGPTPASVTIEALKGTSLVYTYRADTDTGLTGSYSLTVNPTWYLAGNDLNTQAVVSSGKGVSNPLKIYSRKILLSPDVLDFGNMLCGASLQLNATVNNTGNSQLDSIKWITTDLNGPGALKISKSNLGMSPSPVNVIAGGGSKAASATLFVPYNKEAGDYIATMSVYNDRNLNDLADIDEAYDLFNVKVTVPPCKRIFAVQDVVDLGAWPLGQTSVGFPVNVFSGGNIALDNVKFMQLPGATNTFAITVTPANPGPMAITGTLVASVVANIVNTAGTYIATWTVWNDSANLGVVDVGEASDTFQVRIQTGIMSYTLAPLPVNAGSVEPSGLNTGFGFNLSNDAAGLPLTKLRLDVTGLSDGFGNLIASENIAIYTVVNPLPPTIVAGQVVPVDLALFVPAGQAAGLYSATQYLYHDDNANGKWDATEFRAAFLLQATVPPVAKVQVLSTTVGLGGIAPGTSKIVSFPCRNTGNVNLTGLMWEKVNLKLVASTTVIPAANASFPPSELFSVPAGAFFTRQIEVTALANQPYGVYDSIPNHFWLFADMAPTVDGIRTAGEASSSFKVTCEVGDLVVDILEPNLAVTGGPSSLSTTQTLSAKNIGTLALVNMKATGSVLVFTPPVAGADNIVATRNLFSPVSLGGANIGQTKTSNWSVDITPNASAGVYVGTVTVWEDSNNNNKKDTGEAYSDCPVTLTVLAQPAINVKTLQLDLGWAPRNSVTAKSIEIVNVGNMMMNAIWPSKSALIFGANNIPVGSITFDTIPASPFSLNVGEAKFATVSVTIGAVQGGFTYSGIQRIFEDHVAVNGLWDATEVSDTFELIISVGTKIIYETNLTNPAVDLSVSALNVYGTYNLPVGGFGIFSGSMVPLQRVRWKVIGPPVGVAAPFYAFPVASLTFTPANSQFIAGNTNKLYTANAVIDYPPAGAYVATVCFYDDTSNDSIIDSAEASTTFNVKFSVKPNYALDIVKNTVDFGQIAQGATVTKDIMFQNMSNEPIDHLSWSFLSINNAPPTDFLASISAEAIFSPYPVPMGAYATTSVNIHVQSAKKLGSYGTGEFQTLADSVAVGAQDVCNFTCEVVAGGPNVASGSIFQLVATSTFSVAAPNNMYFLSAWICPGSGSADLAFIQYDTTGKAVATVSVQIDSSGKLIVNDPALQIKFSGVSDSVPVEIGADSFNYYRVYMAFEYTYNQAVASFTSLVLHNSGNPGNAVWFDGIKLERGFEGQTRPTTYHPGATLHSPSTENIIQGGRQYYEW